MSSEEPSRSGGSQQYVPFINDVNLDYVIARRGGRTHESLLWRSRRQNRRLHQHHHGQTDPALVDVDAFALQSVRAYRSAWTRRGIVNIGMARTSTSSPAQFRRDISFGGNQYTTPSKKQLSLSF
jgi:Tfp pilus assembly PilM family ATPase